MGHLLLPAPPADFRPATATDAELVKYGFPPRATYAADDRLGQMWMETFGRDVPFTAAQLTRTPRFASRARQPSIVNSDNSPNWSGVVVHNKAGSPINLGIAGTWNVPTLTSVTSGTQSIGIWIGIDGYDPDTAGLLQAGVGGTVNDVGEPVFFAWSEWLSTADPVQPAQPISNFWVQVGDTIETQIWVTSPTTATVVVQNLSRSGSQGGPVIVPLIAPPGVRVIGNDAEWIVERPFLTDQQTYAALPGYSPVAFTNAAAWSQSGNNVSETLVSFGSFALRLGFKAQVSARAIAASLDFAPPISLRKMMSETAIVFAGSGETITMDEGSVPVSTAHIHSKDAIRCEYVGPEPGRLGLAT